MDNIVNKIKESGYQVKSHVIKTDASHACQVMIDFLEANTMDCVVMGSRNLSGWKK